MSTSDRFASDDLSTKRGPSHSIAEVTGTMAAALALNSAVFAMRSDPTAGASWRTYISRIRIEWTTIVAFTTPITAARRLALYRGAGANATGGTVLVPAKKDSSNGVGSEFGVAQGGDSRIATTAALGIAGVTWETASFRQMGLSHVGAAGAYKEVVWEFNSTDAGGPLILSAGELLGILNPVAMDAAGTWQAVINVDYTEAP